MSEAEFFAQVKKFETVQAKLNGGTAVQEPPSEPARVLYRRVADIQARPIQWLWPGRIARGKVSMLAGNPGLGKAKSRSSWRGRSLRVVSGRSMGRPVRAGM